MHLVRKISRAFIVLGLCLLLCWCIPEEETEEDRERNLAILVGLIDAEQAGGAAQVAFRNEYNPGSCPAWYVNVDKDGDTKSVISSTDTNQTSGTVSVPAPTVYDFDIRCSNDSASVNFQGQAVENGRSYLLHYKADGNISFDETAL